MPVFDIENAEISDDFVTRLTNDESIMPYVYGDKGKSGNLTFTDASAFADPSVSALTNSSTGMSNGSGYHGLPPLRKPGEHEAHGHTWTRDNFGAPTIGIGQTAWSMIRPNNGSVTNRLWNFNNAADSQLQYKTDGSHVLNLYDIVYNQEYGFRIKNFTTNTWYNIYFPIEFDEDYATNSTGGGWIDTTQSGTDIDGIGNTGVVQNSEPIPIRFTGDGTTVTNADGLTLVKARPSKALFEDLVRSSCEVEYGDIVIDAFCRYDRTNPKAWVKELDSNGNIQREGEAFPHDTDLAQEHFDMMVNIAWHKGRTAFKYSWFVQEYKYNGTDQTLRNASGVTSASDLDEYVNAAYAMMFLATESVGNNYHRFATYAVNRYRGHIQTMLTGTYFNPRTSFGTGNTIASPAFNCDPNPMTQDINWYQGNPISENWYYAPNNYYGGYFSYASAGGEYGWSLKGSGQAGQGGVANPEILGESTIDADTIEESQNTTPITIQDAIDGISSVPLPATDFWQGKYTAGAQVDYNDIYSGRVSVYDTEDGDSEFYLTQGNYQAYYSKFWQDATSWFHGATAFSSPRAPTKHGAVLASTQHNTLPSFMLGLNENGQGDSKVYIRSFRSQSLVLNGLATDDCFDIANGKTMGTIDYNQWNHFAITREGDHFYTFKNGVMQDSWTSDRSIKIPQPDTRLWLSTGLDLSIGRSQGADHFYGYLDGLRITKGTARHNINSSTGVVTYPVPTAAPVLETAQTNYTGKHYLETVLAALNRIATQLDIEWKIRIGVESDDTNRQLPYANATHIGKVLLDMGPKENLFVGHGTNEYATTIVVRGSSGEDPAITGIDPSSIKSSFDAREYVSTVEYLETGAGQNTDTLDVTDDNIPYRDMNGNLLERIIYATEPEHPHVSKEERARAFLSELKRTKRAIDLDLDYYDIQGDFEVGDNIFIYDPELGFEDNESKKIEDGRTELFEVAYQGEYINPEKIRVTAITHPISSGMGVYLRRLISPTSQQVSYVDLTPYVQFESAGARLEVGDLPLILGDDLRFSPTVTGLNTSDKAATPDKVRDPDNILTNGIKLTSGFIQDALGAQQAIIKVEWVVPLNDDGTIIQNGSHYNIRFKKVGTNDPYTELSQNWGTTEFTIEGLAVATQYEVGVIAVNSNGATGTYVTDFITTSVDTGTPLKPDTATTIAPGAQRVQIIHNLGAAEDSSGNPVSNVIDYTLELDIDHLNVYYSQTSGFSISGMTPKGQIPVTASHLRNEIPAIGEVQVANGEDYYWRFTAVDKAGNESDPSDEQEARGNLIETQNIGTAAITEAKIASLAVTTAKIVDAAITNAKIGDTIQSDNYSAGSTGWIIEKQNANYPNGYAEFSDIVARGDITATTGAIGGWDISSDTLSADYTSGGTTYYLTLDATEGTIEGNYVSGTSGWKIAADGSVDFNDGNFRGDITGSTGTFSGGINIGNGTFVVNSQGGVTLSSITGFHIIPAP